MWRWLQEFFVGGASTLPTGSPAQAHAGADTLTMSAPESTVSAQPVAAAPHGQDPLAPAAVGISTLVWAGLTADFTGWLFARSDYADLQTSRAEQSILAMLDEILASPQAGVQLVRRMPGVIPQLLQSLRTEDFSGAELARRISHDALLVAEVIRLANSSQYATSTPITSIEHAVMVLGQTGLRHLITSVAFRPIIDLKSGHFNGRIAPRIWEHSEQCALACRLLAQQSGGNAFNAFLAGLIQNVGLIVALRVIDQGAAGSAAIGSTAFCNALLPRARQLSSSIGREWTFPDSVIVAIDEQVIEQRGTELSALGQTLATADYLGKLNLLRQHGVLGIDPDLTEALTAGQRDCFAELQALTASTPV